MGAILVGLEQHGPTASIVGDSHYLSKQIKTSRISDVAAMTNGPSTLQLQFRLGHHVGRFRSLKHSSTPYDDGRMMDGFFSSTGNAWVGVQCPPRSSGSPAPMIVDHEP